MNVLIVLSGTTEETNVAVSNIMQHYGDLVIKLERHPENKPEKNVTQTMRKSPFEI